MPIWVRYGNKHILFYSSKRVTVKAITHSHALSYCHELAQSTFFKFHACSLHENSLEHSSQLIQTRSKHKKQRTTFLRKIIFSLRTWALVHLCVIIGSISENVSSQSRNPVLQHYIYIIYEYTCNMFSRDTELKYMLS